MTLLQGDCLEPMKDIPDKSVDVIKADLPFGTTKASWDKCLDLPLLWTQYNRIIKDNGVILLNAQLPFDKILGASNLKMLRYEWVWEKTKATGHQNAKKMPMKAHEVILVFYKKLPYYNPQKTQGHKPVNSYTKYLKTQNKTEIYNPASKEVYGGGNTDRYPRSILLFKSDTQTSKLHSTQKPLALEIYLLKTYCKKGYTVLDNVMGSGTSAVACLSLPELSLSFIGIEKFEKTFEIAKNRILNFKS